MTIEIRMSQFVISRHSSFVIDLGGLCRTVHVFVAIYFGIRAVRRASRRDGAQQLVEQPCRNIAARHQADGEATVF